MIDFMVDSSKCTSCMSCVNDCLARIIEMDDNKIPFVATANEGKCVGCQHCLTICPEAAVSVLGKRPEDSVPASLMADYTQTDALIRNRRSVRKFRDKDIDTDKLDKIIKAAANAPTGKNSRKVLLTLTNSAEDTAKIKEMFITRIEKMLSDGTIPDKYKMFGDKVALYRKGKDVIFRNAPHIMIASCPKSVSTGIADGLIALTYAELAAYTLGVGVTWAGNMMFMYDFCADLFHKLGVPEDHNVCYVIYFGESALKYPRGAQRDEIALNVVKL